jgi:GntR family transcriptional regulator
VKEALLERIIEGAWPAGTLIPSEPELCREFEVSRITVRRAVGDLAHLGIVNVVQGKGSFVAKPKLHERFVQRAFGIYEDMARRGLELTTEVLRQEVVPASGEVADRLGISRGKRVHLIVRARAVEGEKILVSTTHLPEALCPDLVHDDLSRGSLYRLLEDRYGLRLSRGDRRLEAVAAGPWESCILDVAVGSPLLQLDSVAYLADGHAFEYSRALQRGDRAAVDIEFLAVPEEQGIPAH